MFQNKIKKSSAAAVGSPPPPQQQSQKPKKGERCVREKREREMSMEGNKEKQINMQRDNQGLLVRRD